MDKNIAEIVFHNPVLYELKDQEGERGVVYLISQQKLVIWCINPSQGLASTNSM